MTINNVKAAVGINSTTFATFDQKFAKNTFSVPAGGAANSGMFGNVNLTQGFTNSLEIVGQNPDLQSVDIQVT